NTTEASIATPTTFAAPTSQPTSAPPGGGPDATVAVAATGPPPGGAEVGWLVGAAKVVGVAIEASVVFVAVPVAVASVVGVADNSATSVASSTKAPLSPARVGTGVFVAAGAVATAATCVRLLALKAGLLDRPR